MSVTLSKLQRSDPSAKLYLKTPDGTMHGPLSVADLGKWAAQNRLPPGSKVSDDCTAWSPVEVIEELKLEWDAKCVDGRTVGPYNLLAIPLLVQDGSLVAGDTLVNRISNRSVQVRDLLKPGTTIVRKKAAAQGGVAGAADASGEKSDQQELFASPPVAQNRQAPVPDGERIRAARRAVGGRDSESVSPIVRLKELLANGSEENERLKAALSQEKLRHAETRRTSEFDGRLLRERVTGLEAEQRDLSTRLADALKEVDALRQNDESMRAAIGSKEAELAARNVELEKASGSSSAEAAKMKAAIDQEKALHAEALRQK